jgi:hypothetical protein
MGKIVKGFGRTMFGGPSKSKSKGQQSSVSDTASGNYAYPELLETFRPTMGQYEWG